MSDKIPAQKRTRKPSHRGQQTTRYATPKALREPLLAEARRQFLETTGVPWEKARPAIDADIQTITQAFEDRRIAVRAVSLLSKTKSIETLEAAAQLTRFVESLGFGIPRNNEPRTIIAMACYSSVIPTNVIVRMAGCVSVLLSDGERPELTEEHLPLTARDALTIEVRRMRKHLDEHARDLARQIERIRQSQPDLSDPELDELVADELWQRDRATQTHSTDWYIPFDQRAWFRLLVCNQHSLPRDKRTPWADELIRPFEDELERSKRR